MTSDTPKRETEALLSVLRTAAVLEHGLGEALRPHGLTLTQYHVLRALHAAEPAGLCGRELGERLVSQVPDVSRLLDRMAETGLVARARDTRDRRHVTARITAQGSRLLEAVEPALGAVAEARLGYLGDARLRGLVAALADVREGE